MIEILSLAVLAAAAVPACRIVLQPVLWRHHATVCILVATALFIYAVALVMAWGWLPEMLPVAAVPAVAGTGLFWWRGRAGYGVKRGLPPGRLAMVDSLRSVVDHRYYLRQAARYGSVFKMSQFHRPTVCITDLALARDLIRSDEHKLRPPPLRFDRFIPRRYIRYMETEDHRHYREILKTIVRPEITNINRDLIRASCATWLARMADAACESSGVRPSHWMSGLCYDIFPVLFFGLKPESGALARLQSHYRKLDDFSLHHRYPDDIEDILQAIEAIILEQTRDLSQRRNDQPSSFLEALVKRDPAAIEDISLRRNLLYVMRITRGDVTGLLNWVWYFVAEEPEVLDRVRREPEPGTLRSWRNPTTPADRVVAETLRLEQSEYLYREVRADISWNEWLIPRGWLVRLCTRDAHQSTDHFKSPERFDPDRFSQDKLSPDAYSPFGMGRHSCIGAHLAFNVARTLVYELASGYDVTPVSNGKRTLGGRHWMHWKPDESFRVRIKPRVA